MLDVFQFMKLLSVMLNGGIGVIVIGCLNKELGFKKCKQSLPIFVNEVPLFFHCSILNM